MNKESPYLMKWKETIFNGVRRQGGQSAQPLKTNRHVVSTRLCQMQKGVLPRRGKLTRSYNPAVNVAGYVLHPTCGAQTTNSCQRLRISPI